MAANQQPERCEICGRTMLPGESARLYVTLEGEQLAVCDLCKANAESVGWVRADRAGALPAAAASGGGRRGGIVRRLLARTRARGEDAPRTAGPRAGSADDADGEAGSSRRPRIRPSRTRPPEERQPSPPRDRPAAISPRERVRRALERFNASEHSRTVAGLTRSLGPPKVAATSVPEAPDEVRLTVAWELSWYQWQVSFGAMGGGVLEVAKGKELSELDERDRAWNAHASEDGKLHPGARDTEQEPTPNRA